MADDRKIGLWDGEKVSTQEAMPDGFAECDAWLRAKPASVGVLVFSEYGYCVVGPTGTEGVLPASYGASLAVSMAIQDPRNEDLWREVMARVRDGRTPMPFAVVTRQ